MQEIEYNLGPGAGILITIVALPYVLVGIFILLRIASRKIEEVGSNSLNAIGQVVIFFGGTFLLTLFSLHALLTRLSIEWTTEFTITAVGWVIYLSVGILPIVTGILVALEPEPILKKVIQASKSPRVPPATPGRPPPRWEAIRHISDSQTQSPSKKGPRDVPESLRGQSKCPKCFAALPRDASFCNKCGTHQHQNGLCEI